MNNAVIIYAAVAALVVVVALAVWLFDARRNRNVQHEEERLDSDPTGEAGRSTAREVHHSDIDEPNREV